MKKTIALLLAILLCMSVLAACGGETNEPDTRPVDKPESTPAPEVTPEPKPEPEPVADGMNTVEITNSDYGDIIFSYPDDGSVTVIIAEPGAEDKSLIPEDDMRALLDIIIQSDNDIEFQKALIAGDDFNIMVGYTNYFDSGSTLKSFGMVERDKLSFDGEPLTLDGLDGVVYTQNITTIIFPAITQYAGRVILVFPNSVDEDDRVSDISRSLFERADIQAIINTFSFPGEILDEPRFETQPADNEIFSITPTDGWELTNMSFMWHTYQLRKGEMKLNTKSSSSTPVSEMIDEYLSDANVYNDMEQIDNATFNGQEYVVLHDEGWRLFVLLTSRGGGPLDIDGEGHFLMEIQHIDSLDDVAALLNTVTVH